jgi:uncharacterized protein
VLIVVSPAKSLDYETPVLARSLPAKRETEPELLDHSEELIAIMRSKSAKDLERLMSISPSLAQLNYDRFQDWERPFPKGAARQALLAFNGDVYDGMSVRSTFSVADFTHAQKTLRILSGLYGVLRPLDLMLPYRLEMGTRLATPKGNTLYAYWGDVITDTVRAALVASPGEKVLVNLASEEYFGSVRTASLGHRIVAPAFLDTSDAGAQRIVSFFAKKARGIMSAWIIRERITRAKDLREFTGGGYAYDPSRSTDERPVFVR